MTIYNAVVCPMDGPQIPKGFVAWENGVITQVGDMSRCPTPVSGQDVDAQGGYVLPWLRGRPLSSGAAGGWAELRRGRLQRGLRPLHPAAPGH